MNETQSSRNIQVDSNIIKPDKKIVAEDKGESDGDMAEVNSQDMDVREHTMQGLDNTIFVEEQQIDISLEQLVSKQHTHLPTPSNQKNTPPEKQNTAQKLNGQIDLGRGATGQYHEIETDQIKDLSQNDFSQKKHTSKNRILRDRNHIQDMINTVGIPNEVKYKSKLTKFKQLITLIGSDLTNGPIQQKPKIESVNNDSPDLLQYGNSFTSNQNLLQGMDSKDKSVQYDQYHQQVSDIISKDHHHHPSNSDNSRQIGKSKCDRRIIQNNLSDQIRDTSIQNITQTEQET